MSDKPLWGLIVALALLLIVVAAVLLGGRFGYRWEQPIVQGASPSVQSADSVGS